MINFIRNIIAFNQIQRDKWVKKMSLLVNPGSSVLDVAAGTCPYRNLFVKCKYQSHDLGELKSEQNRGGKQYPLHDFRCNVTALPVQDGEFDVVICTEGLEHFPDPISALREMARVIKPGGLIILSAPLGSGIHQEPYHFYGGFTPYWYRYFLEMLQFEKIIIEENGGSYKHFGQESIRIMKMLMPWNLQCPPIVKIIYLPILIILTPLLGVVIPIFCTMVDKYDRDKKFTVGYHVHAIKLANLDSGK